MQEALSVLHVTLTYPRQNLTSDQPSVFKLTRMAIQFLLP